MLYTILRGWSVCYYPICMQCGGCAQKVESSKALPKLSVKFILHATGNIAAKFLYDPVMISYMPLYYLFFPFWLLVKVRSFSKTLCFISCQVLVGALRKVPKANWNAKERSLFLHICICIHVCLSLFKVL